MGQQIETRPWDEAPQDGTVICISHFVRYNVVGKHWEIGVAEGQDDAPWVPIDLSIGKPSTWFKPDSVPEHLNVPWFRMLYTVTYKRMTWRERLQRLFDRLLRRVAA